MSRLCCLTESSEMPVCPDRDCHADSTPRHQAHPLTSATDLAKKQYHWEKFGNQNIQMVDLAQALKAAGDKKVTVEMAPQDRGSFTPSTMVQVK